MKIKTEYAGTHSETVMLTSNDPVKDGEIQVIPNIIDDDGIRLFGKYYIDHVVEVLESNTAAMALLDSYLDGACDRLVEKVLPMVVREGVRDIETTIHCRCDGGDIREAMIGLIGEPDTQSAFGDITYMAWTAMDIDRHWTLVTATDFSQWGERAVMRHEGDARNEATALIVDNDMAFKTKLDNQGRWEDERVQWARDVWESLPPKEFETVQVCLLNDEWGQLRSTFTDMQNLILQKGMGLS